MGVVYKAEDTRLGRNVALKFLPEDISQDPQAIERFRREARAASSLNHPSICTIYDIGEFEGRPFIAMELLEGQTLKQRISKKSLPTSELLDIAVQITEGLEAAHAKGIVHRDIKPGNLFLTDDGLVKILDFGIAKLSGEVGPTRLGSALGTPSYMAPEQTRGEEVDARADVWSLGVVLYEMLAGRRPFVGGSGTAVVYAVLHEEPESLASLRPEVPRELLRIVSRMLAKDPRQRYSDAVEVLADLRAALDLPSTASRISSDCSTRGAVSPRTACTSSSIDLPS